MKYFNYLSPQEVRSLFHIPPTSLDSIKQSDLLAQALGATLYTPAIKKTIVEDIINKKYLGLISLILDLEDAVGDNQLAYAENLLIQHILHLAQHLDKGTIPFSELPFLFIRVRSCEQMKRITEMVGQGIQLVTGFVFPKFSANGYHYFDELERINSTLTQPLFAMPVIETAEVLYKETRIESLLKIKQILDEYKELVLNVRIGATDFSSLLGIRRSPEYTIYDTPIRDVISDIVNLFARAENGYVVSGPVWEYFQNKPFSMTSDSPGLGSDWQAGPFAGLIREAMRDKIYGLTGKTIIHPSHIPVIQALQVVTHEEYFDACDIIAAANGELGVIKSRYGNKMNEIKPHLTWAKKILTKSKIYGVFHEQQTFVNLLRTREKVSLG